MKDDSVEIEMLESRFINGKLAEKGAVGEVSAKEAHYLIRKGWAKEADPEEDEKPATPKKAAKK